MLACLRFSWHTTCLKRPPGVGMSARMSTLKPGLSPCAYWPKRPTSSRETDARSFEAVALERAHEVVVLAGVFRSVVGEHRIKEAPAARVEPKGLCCAGDVVQLQADSLRFD